MINFRYHLISLVSVFLALAVGIVLGAGPLSGPIESTFEDQIGQLRSDKDALRLELEQSGTALQLAGDSFQMAWPQLLGDRLVGLDVAVLTVGQGLSERVEGVRQGLSQAGGNLTTVTHLDNRLLVEPEGEPANLVDELVQLGVAETGLPYEQVVGQALAYALAGTEQGADDGSYWPQAMPVPSPGPGGLPGTEDPLTGTDTASDEPTSTGQPSPTGQPTPPGASPSNTDQPDQPEEVEPKPDPTEVWQVLHQAGLISGDQPKRAAQVVIVLVSHLERFDAEPDTEMVARRAHLGEQLWRACLESQLPVVISGPSDQDGDVVALIRADKETASATTTLDLPIVAVEVVGVLWAAARAVEGGFGSYGLNGSSSRILPPAPRLPEPTLTPAPPSTATPPGPTGGPVGQTPGTGGSPTATPSQSEEADGVPPASPSDNETPTPGVGQ